MSNIHFCCEINSCIVVGTVMGCKIRKMKKAHTKEHSAYMMYIYKIRLKQVTYRETTDRINSYKLNISFVVLKKLI